MYVAQIAMGANDTQATKALLEADAYPGTSLIIAYSTCIAHGIDMSKSMTHQKDAVRSGYWPLYRFHPSQAEEGQPFQLDSKAPSIPLAEFVATEARYATWPGLTLTRRLAWRPSRRQTSPSGGGTTSNWLPCNAPFPGSCPTWKHKADGESEDSDDEEVE